MAGVIGKDAVAVRIDGDSPRKEAGPSTTVHDKDKGKEALASVDLDPDWVTSIKKKLQKEPVMIKASSTGISCSIHRVPQRFRQHSEKAYVPQIISIGPFHYDRREDHLRAMEEHKWKYLSGLVNRGKLENCLEQFLIVVKQLEGKARGCYSEEIMLDSNSFAEMMVLDACFLIELFCRAMEVDVYKYDPIIRFGWLKHAITTDLVMLENQIPFFIVQHLCSLMSISGVGLARMALNFFDLRVNDPNIEVQHLLHLLHSSRLPRQVSRSSCPLQKINTASKLKESGIKFKMGDGKGFLDIKFVNGVIEIPPLKVEDTTTPLFLNLVAFEQCYRHCNSYFAGYAYFMDCLIDTTNDVEILCQTGIIDRWLGTHEDVATLFNKIGREVIVYDDDFYLRGVCDEINRHHKTHWNVWRATLMHNYFNNPWTTISVIAAIIFLLLSLTQTFFTVCPKFAYGH